MSDEDDMSDEEDYEDVQQGDEEFIDEAPKVTTSRLHRERKKQTPKTPTQEFSDEDVSSLVEELKAAGKTPQDVIHEFKDITHDLEIAKETRTELENQVQDLKKLIDTDFGPENVFYSFYGKTFPLTTRQYTYTLHPFDRVEQDSTSLGTWKGYEKDYTIMKFENGATCWGAASRSSTINLVCGAENDLRTVEEPSKCVYIFEMTTPAVCSKDHLTVLEINSQSFGQEQEELSSL